MNKPNFTPGPWFVGEDGEVDCVFNKARSTIAQCFNHASIDRKDSNFNSLLIAAAPDMYAALEYYMKAHGRDLDVAHAKAKFALAKARGENETTS